MFQVWTSPILPNLSPSPFDEHAIVVGLCNAAKDVEFRVLFFNLFFYSFRKIYNYFKI
jgi:hypothetical protein